MWSEAETKQRVKTKGEEFSRLVNGLAEPLDESFENCKNR